MSEYSNKGLNITASCSFPSQLAPYSEKKDESFGLDVARAIESEWFYGNGGGCKFYTSRSEMLLRRAYAKGIQPMHKYFTGLGTNGDKSYLNLPQKPISIIPKLVAMVCNGMAERDYVIKANAIDKLSQNKRKDYRDRVENDFLAKDIIVKAQETLGADIGTMPLDQLPETNEELDLHMQLKYKPSIEISAEVAIDVVFQENEYKETVASRNRKDLTVLGVAWAKHDFIPTRGIVQKYVDPANKVQSYSECPRFSDCFYHGEFKTVLISDVLVEYPWINDKPELKAQLEYSCDNWYNYHSIAQDQRIKGTTNLLYFTYKTTRVRPKKIKEKGTGEKILSEADESFDETNITKNDFKRLDKKVEEIEFQGVYVLGTDIILKWEVAENMIRPKSNKQQIISQYIGSAPNREGTYIDSLVARMMPIDDELQIVRLKNCQMIQRMIPDGYFFDIDAFISIDLGTGEVKPQELFDMLFQTGSTMGRSYSSDGNYNAAKLPVSELRMPGNIDKINQLRLEREFNFNLLREVIGLNNASDASSPEKDSLVGIQKLAAANSNVATRDILHGTNDITLRMAQASFCRVSDVLKYSELKEDLIQKIGATATLDIESVKDLHLSDFAIFLELDLDDDERAQLEADLSREIDKGFIDTSDKYTILGIRNFKTAVQYLAILKKKKQKEQEAIKMREIQAQTKANIESAQSAEQAKQQTAQLEGQIKSQVQQAITQGELEKEKIRGEENRKSLEVEYSLKNNLQLLINSGQSEKIHKMESAKDERSLQEATMQGEIAYNKEKGAKPTDFVAENAGLEQFDLTE